MTPDRGGEGTSTGTSAQSVTGVAVHAGRRQKTWQESLASSGLEQTPFAADFNPDTALSDDPRRRILFKGGTILSMDPAVGDFVTGDVLVEGRKIVAVGATIDASATVTDASGMIVMPGLVDAHRHLWSAVFKRAIPDADGQVYSDLANALIPVLNEADIVAATRLSDATAIRAGVTTMLDYSHLSKTPNITDAAIDAHKQTGLRVVFAYAPPRSGPSEPQHPADLARILDEHFRSSDQMVSLRLGTRLISENYALARQLGVGITSDGVFGTSTPLRPFSSSPRLMEMSRAGELGPDVTIIHGTGFPEEVLRAIAESGANLVLAPTSDSTLRGLGDSTPPIQGVLDHRLIERTGISVDIDVSLAPDLFAQMRGIFTIQRLLANRRWAAGDTDAPAPISVRDILTMATVGGARASGLIDKVGTLTPGKEADLILIRADDVMNAPLNSAVGTVVIGAGVDSVEAVMVQGRLKKWRGKLVACDEASLVRAARDSRDRIATAAGVWRRQDIIA